MSQFDSANYPTVTPVAADLVLLLQASSGLVKTANLQGLANAAQSLASLNLSVVVYSSDQTLDGEDQFVEANSGGVFNLTLPASSLNTGRGYHIFNKGAGAVTILPNGADTIKGAASLVLAQYESAILRSDGLGMWAVVLSA